MGPEMLLHRRKIVKTGRIFLIFGLEGDRLPCFVFPLFDQLWIAADLNRPPVIAKTHPAAESLVIQRPQGRLKRMVIGWAQDLARQSAPGHGGEIPFDWLFF